MYGCLYLKRRPATKAIDFYIKMGFQPIGFGLFCYTNCDPDKEEVRLEMAKTLI